jgi:sugar phosphate isomerase/epimerase
MCNFRDGRFRVKICSLAGSVGSEFDNDGKTVRDKEIEKVKKEIDLAVDVGATVIRVGPGHGENLDKIWDKIIPCLKEVTKYAEKKNIKIGMENHSGGIACKAEQAAKVCQEISSKYLGIIYEPGNLFGALEDYKKGFEIQKDYIVYVHLKDGYPHYFGNDEYAPQRLFCTVFGKGELDIPWILQSLKETDYRGFVSVEYESWHKEYNLPEVESGLKECAVNVVKWLERE